MNLPVLKSHALVARIIGLKNGGEINRSPLLDGTKTDDELILGLSEIGRGVSCLRIERYAQITYEYSGMTHTKQTEAIGHSNFYLIQHDLTKKIGDRFRDIPVHPKLQGVVRIVGSARKVPQPNAA